MSLWERLLPHRTARLQARLANEIAQRSRAEVWNRIEHRASTMRLAEARGYMRARAAEAIHREVGDAAGVPGRTRILGQKISS